MLLFDTSFIVLSSDYFWTFLYTFVEPSGRLSIRALILIISANILGIFNPFPPYNYDRNQSWLWLKDLASPLLIVRWALYLPLGSSSFWQHGWDLTIVSSFLKASAWSLCFVLDWHSRLRPGTNLELFAETWNMFDWLLGILQVSPG